MSATANPAHADEKIYVNGRFLNPAAVLTCPRCGYQRERNSRTRDRSPLKLCLDCRIVENRIDNGEQMELHQWVRKPGGIVHFDPMPQPMTPEDLAWCERQADRHFWRTFERANRRGGATAAQIDEALRRTA